MISLKNIYLRFISLIPPTQHRKDTVAILKIRFSTSQQMWRGHPIGSVFMELGGFDEQHRWWHIFCRISPLKIKKIPKRNVEFFLTESWLQNPKVLFPANHIQSCVLTISSLSRRVNYWKLSFRQPSIQPLMTMFFIITTFPFQCFTRPCYNETQQ